MYLHKHQKLYNLFVNKIQYSWNIIYILVFKSPQKKEDNNEITLLLLNFFCSSINLMYHFLTKLQSRIATDKTLQIIY